MTAEETALVEPNLLFATPVGAETIERTANALRAKGYDIHVTPDRAAGRRSASHLDQITLTGRQEQRPSRCGARPRPLSVLLEGTCD